MFFGCNSSRQNNRIKLSMTKIFFFAFLIITQFAVISAQNNSLVVEGEKRLRNIKQLTFGGENAEAYFSPDGKKLIFQSKSGGLKCDQMFTMNIDGSNVRRVSNGKGRVTCGYFLNGGKRIVYSSTHGASDECPTPPDRSQGYVWPVYPTYDIYTANADGTKIKRLTNTNAYDAEATLSPDGKTIVFTSTRDGDLDIYTMDINGKNVKRLTDELGYNGGAFFSPDGKQIVYRAYYPETEEEIARYKDFLAKDLIEPNVYEIWVMNADGSNKRKITDINSASFAPFFTPDGKAIIFSTDYYDRKNNPERRRQPNFDLVVVNLDGSGMERITFNDSFDGFPMFSPDGKKLVFASNRNSTNPGDTNVFIADWVY